MVTITDISKACGVSRATVSKALNGAPDIAQKTAERIREQARALGYLPNANKIAVLRGEKAADKFSVVNTETKDAYPKDYVCEISIPVGED